MTVKKVKGGYKIKHCRSGKKGYIKATPKPVSKKKAMSIHRAIMVNKKKKQDKNDKYTYKSPFLTENRENEICMLFRKEEKLILCTLKETLSPDAS